MDDAIISEIISFIETHPAPKLPANATLSSEDFRRYGYTPRALYPVVSNSDIAKAEADVGFPIPRLLRRFYLEVSNGIAGFSYDIIGLQGGCASSAGTLVGQYFDLKAAFDHLERPWKPGLLPFCDWGCCNLSCVDSTDPNAPIVTYDPDELWMEEYTLSEFFGMWIKGSVHRSNSHASMTREIINPFTKKKTTVSGRKRTNPPT